MTRETFRPGAPAPARAVPEPGIGHRIRHPGSAPARVDSTRMALFPRTLIPVDKAEANVNNRAS